MVNRRVVCGLINIVSRAVETTLLVPGENDKSKGIPALKRRVWIAKS